MLCGKIAGRLLRRRSSFAKSHARLVCSVVNALATTRCRYQLFTILCARAGNALITAFSRNSIRTPRPRRGGPFGFAAIFYVMRQNRRAVAPSPLLFRKKSRLACLLGCKRPRDDSLPLPTFCAIVRCARWQTFYLTTFSRNSIRIPRPYCGGPFWFAAIFMFCGKFTALSAEKLPRQLKPAGECVLFHGCASRVLLDVL